MLVGIGKAAVSYLPVYSSWKESVVKNTHSNKTYLYSCK